MNGYSVILESFASPLIQLREYGLAHRQRLIAARLALRLDAYRRKNGRLPDSLGVVLDETLPVSPSGVILGKPFVYERSENGFRIYRKDMEEDRRKYHQFRVEYPSTGGGRSS